ncbi:MAG: M20/M25/M40 family metallo-hydrolase [Planctomycetota bacterium]
MRSAHRVVAMLAILSLVSIAEGKERAHLAALQSIQADELLAHVEVLADDAYEGRASGSRGGRAAAAYLVGRLEEMGVAGGAAGGGYYQPFSRGRRNVLAQFPGDDSPDADPNLSKEWIVVGAHYDHVGYGDSRTSFGPIGYIHNGADDNASGVAALLEFCEAMTTGDLRFRRSVLVAFWDGEEVGMLGSQHWMRQPTVPVQDVRLSINIDMVGRLREGRIELAGTRTGYGLRRLASVVHDPEVWLDFTWVLEPNSDHWTFISRGVPTLMLHTGLHDNYHRPSDDVETLNIEGIRTVSRYLFDLVSTAADAPALPQPRRQGRTESASLQKSRERLLPPLPENTPPPRVGLAWREDQAEPGSVFLTRVVANSPADTAGLQPLDRVLAIDGEAFTNSADFEQRLQASLAADAEEILLLVERRGRVEPAIVRPN